jgi:TrmH family RNA methyltransferase
MITSKKNPRIQFIRSLLQDRKTREESGLFLIEGIRLVEEAVANHAIITEAYFSSFLSERGKRLVENLIQNSIPIEEVEESVFLSVMDTSNSQGIAVICRIPKTGFPDKLDFIILADQLHDPGNLGTLLRTAVAAGAQAVFTTPGSVDLFSPKVVRSAMGAHFHLVCFETKWEQIQQMLHEKSATPISVYTAVANGSLQFWECDFTLPSLLIIGSEAEGVSDEALSITNHKVSIPMPGNFESLNAAVAAGIIIYEVVRQRTI